MKNIPIPYIFCLSAAVALAGIGATVVASYDRSDVAALHGHDYEEHDYGEQEAAYTWPTPTAADLELVRGAIDIHAHLDPDSVGEHSSQAARSIDVIDMAKRVKELGMRGFVIKQHYDQSAQLAQIVRKEVPGVEVFGLVGQNRSIGGLNPEAIYHFSEIQGGHARIVMLPTWDAENYVKKSRNPNRPFISVSRNGALVPEVVEVIKATATAKTRDTNADLVLATGHSSAEEVLLIVKEAKRQGVKKVVVTHGIGNPEFMTIPQMQEAANDGAYIEFVAGYAMGAKPAFTMEQYADAMRKIGLNRIIVSTDLGQRGRPIPPDGLALFAGQLLKQGFTKAELKQIMADNPAELLGLPTAPPSSAANRP